MNSQAQKFEAAVRKHFDHFAQQHSLKFFKPVASLILGDVGYENETIAIEFLYDAPEWHVELNLKCKKSGRQIGLNELGNDPTIMEWWRRNLGSGKNSDPLDAELVWYLRLLTETRALDTCMEQVERE